MAADRLAKRQAGARRGGHADDQHGGRAGAAPHQHPDGARQGRRPLRAGRAQRRGWQLGGEGSGHLLALDRHTTGDGIVSALQIMQAMRRSGRTLAALLEGVTLFPQTLINVRLRDGSDWKKNARLDDAQQTAARELGDAGRVLIRASGTEPVLRVMVEASDADVGRRCAERLAAAAQG
jgi:phosphoglucosamine mutase